MTAATIIASADEPQGPVVQDEVHANGILSSNRGLRTTNRRTQRAAAPRVPRLAVAVGQTRSGRVSTSADSLSEPVLPTWVPT